MVVVSAGDGKTTSENEIAGAKIGVIRMFMLARRLCCFKQVVAGHARQTAAPERICDATGDRVELLARLGILSTSQQQLNTALSALYDGACPQRG
uniref:Transposase n=1 Tax=Peronospora matthiolae TaxID=2874970 RepID=A0AAV1VGF8_9STRA